MTALLCLLAAVPTGPRYSSGSAAAESAGGRAKILEEAVTNTLPATIPIWVIVLILAVAILIAVVIICIALNPPQSYTRRKMEQRMMQDRAFLNTNYFNTVSGIQNEIMRNGRR